MTLVELPSAESTRALVTRLQETSPEFGGLVERFGDAARAFRHVGLGQWQGGRFALSMEAFLAALSLTPENPDLWRDLAGVCSANGEPERAESAIKTSLVLDARHAQSWLILAGLLDRRDDVDEAGAAYRHAVTFDPTLAAAHFGLGLLAFKKKHYADALAFLSLSVEHDPTNAFAQACLGHVLYLSSDFAGSALAFDTAARLAPLDPESRRKRARALTLQSMIEGDVQEALLAYGEIAGADREDLDMIARDSFSLLSVNGHLAAAAEIGRMRLADKPDDPIRRYLLDAVSGRAVTAAPADYIESSFDQFAPQFDQKLVETLRYVAPALMVESIARHRSRFSRMLDLGCGTGLAADGLASFGETLIGVDLSSGMLAEAARRGCYTDLVKSEVVAFLTTSTGPFDLIFAADLLIYFGELAPLLNAASAALVTGGLLALNVEAGSEADFTLLPSGRFTHSPGYLDRLTKADFIVLEQAEHPIRLEAGRSVLGHYFLLERRSSPE